MYWLATKTRNPWTGVRSVGERERSQVQRLLLEGMMDACGIAAYDKPYIGPSYPAIFEAYGHLAVALLPQMVEAPDDRLDTLAAQRFLPTILLAFSIGAKAAPCSSPVDRGRDASWRA